jgi:hypothetical protein
MNVSAGDLAYVVANNHPENIGLVVKVVAPYGFVNFDDGRKFVWVCETGADCIGKKGWLTVPVKKGTTVDIADEILRRIAGPSVDTTDIVERPVEELA